MDYDNFESIFICTNIIIVCGDACKNVHHYYDCIINIMTFRHRANCPGVGEEHFIAVAGLHSGGSIKQLISEFFF